jgi:hypothetical protein
MFFKAMGIVMLVVLSSPAVAAEPAPPPHYLTVCCPDQQAFELAVSQEDVYLKVAVFSYVLVACVVPTVDQANIADLKYFADAMYVLAMMSGTLDKARLETTSKAVDAEAKAQGLVTFCGENKPSVDRVVDFARQNYSQDLERNFQSMQRRR